MDVICCVLSRPIRRQVCPASDDLYIPSPSPSRKELRSPVPTYITLGSDGATSTAPMDETLRMESKIGNHVAPALMVRALRNPMRETGPTLQRLKERHQRRLILLDVVVRRRC